MSETISTPPQGQGLAQARDVMLYCLVSLSQRRYQHIGRRLERRQEYVRALASELASGRGLDAEGIDLLCLAMPLHDIGMAWVPDAVLMKPGRLSAD